MAKKVLVTGADGFIGSHLTEQLVRAGHDVRAFVYYNSFNSWGWLDTIEEQVLTQIEVVSGDIRDASGVDFATSGCSHVLHLAALIAIPFSYNSPDAYVQTNVTGTLNVLQAARRNNAAMPSWLPVSPTRPAASCMGGATPRGPAPRHAAQGRASRARDEITEARGNGEWI